MKRKVISLVLVLLTMMLVLPGCVSKAELEEYQTQIADQAVQIAGLEDQVENQTAQITELEGQIAELGEQKVDLEGQKVELEGKNAELEGQKVELEEQNAELQTQLQYLREPPPEKVSGEVAGYISYKKTVEIGKERFTRFGVAGSAKHSYPLMSIETLKQFLANDQTDKYPSHRPGPYDAGDGWAFQLKAHWMEDDLSAWSLGLAKIEIDTRYGSMLVWRNIFLTKENGEFVFYEVNPCTDEIIKIEGSTEKYRLVMITDKLWIID